MAPWSTFWERNAFASTELLATVLSNAFVRGGVSGIGVITAFAGLAELSGAFRSRRDRSDTTEAPNS